MIRLAAYIAMFVAIIGGGLWGASAAYVRAAERAVSHQYISDALDVLAMRPNTVEWGDPVADLVRPFTPGDGNLIGRTLTEAWSALSLAQSTGNPAILSDSFSGVALERAAQSVADATLGGQMAVLAQTAQPQFYHLDGSLFQADVSMLSVRYFTDGPNLTYYEITRDHAVSTLMNESNGWRIFSHERLGAAPIIADRAGWDGPTLVGLNYYPTKTPWRAFWRDFDADVIAEDFARIKALGGNSVRIFLTADVFADGEDVPAALGRLKTLLDLAEAADLSVMPTLFDLKYQFDPSTWAQDYAMLQSVVPVLAASEAVVLIDLKNEPDLDFEAHGRPQILAWLTTMAHLVRLEAPDLALTIGWSSSDAALELEDIVDVVSYHDYADAASSGQRLLSVQAATSRPVMVTEIGASSYSVALGLPGSEAGQGRALSERLDALQAADGVFIWTLHDFEDVDASAVGASPWVQRLQGRFGLIAPDGQEKPAAAVVRQAFARMSRGD